MYKKYFLIIFILMLSSCTDSFINTNKNVLLFRSNGYINELTRQDVLSESENKKGKVIGYKIALLSCSLWYDGVFNAEDVSYIKTNASYEGLYDLLSDQHGEVQGVLGIDIFSIIAVDDLKENIWFYIELKNGDNLMINDLEKINCF